MHEAAVRRIEASEGVAHCTTDTTVERVRPAGGRFNPLRVSLVNPVLVRGQRGSCVNPLWLLSPHHRLGRRVP